MADSIVIFDRGSKAYTDICLNSLRKIIEQDSEIILIGEYTEENRASFPEDLPIRLINVGRHENNNAAAIWNLGYRAASNDTILFMYENIVLSANAYDIMRHTLYSSEEIGAVSPFVNNSRHLHFNEYIDAYSSKTELDISAAKFEASSAGSRAVIFCESFCLMTKRSVIERIGTFDERMGSIGYEDIDFSLRLIQEGFHAAAAPTFVHENAMTEQQFPVDFTNSDDEKLFEDKWGIVPNYSANIRDDLMNMADLSKEGIAVLDIGCACGGNLLYIKCENPSAKTYGIELNPYAAKIASNFGEVKSVDVETMELSDWEGRFDVIIMGDIIEHLRDPEGALRHVKKLLKADGVLLASIPNVLYIGNVALMMKGKWEYTDSGILDRTHLRFFTRDSIQELMSRVGLKISMLSSKIPRQLDPSYKSLIDGLTGLDEVTVQKDDFLAIQWIFKAENSA